MSTPSALSLDCKLVPLPNRPYESVAFGPDACLDLLPFRQGTVDGIVWKPLTPHHDARGWLCELCRQGKALLVGKHSEPGR